MRKTGEVVFYPQFVSPSPGKIIEPLLENKGNGMTNQEQFKPLAERIYSRLDKLLAAFGGLKEILITPNFHTTLKAQGFMDLSIEIIRPGVIAMAHNYIQNGDVMADPDMEIEINYLNKSAQAKTFQQDGLGIYQSTWDNVNLSLESKLNNFLYFWLGNIQDQGFKADPSHGSKE
jgi:hypothetical protein